MWIARSEGDSWCHLFVYKPVKVYDKYQRRWKWESDPKSPFDGLMLPASKYKLITFENSPMEVELKLVNDVQG